VTKISSNASTANVTRVVHLVASHFHETRSTQGTLTFCLLKIYFQRSDYSVREIIEGETNILKVCMIKDILKTFNICYGNNQFHEAESFLRK